MGEQATTTAASDGWEDLEPSSMVDAEKGREYWQGEDASDHGMLGGFPRLSPIDLRTSKGFLGRLGLGRRLTSKSGAAGEKSIRRALEGGAGIGRITKGMLLGVSDTVDVIEPIAKFTAKLEGTPGVGDIFNVGLQDWRPDLKPSSSASSSSAAAAGGDDDEKEEDKNGEEQQEKKRKNPVYDLIWIQWCSCHLTDPDLVSFLRRCQEVLSRPGSSENEENNNNNSAAPSLSKPRKSGIIVLKENTSYAQEDIFDESDKSVTRADEKYRQLFEQAGLHIVKTELQHGFPSQLFPVRMYALRPEGWS